MRPLNATEPPYPADDGAADPAVAAALTAYAAGQGSEHAALTALAGSRLLVPVVAVLTEEAGSEEAGAGKAVSEQARGTGAHSTQGAPGAHQGLRREKSTEMALPTLVGRDGRHAVLAFTSMAALTRWRGEARPVPVPAARAWQAGTQDASAVVIDVAGPVPLTVDGARLAALAAGQPVPPPHEDPDVLAAARAAAAREPLLAQITVGQASHPGSDLGLRVTLATGCDAAAAAAAVGRVADTMLAATGGRLRRGMDVSIVTGPQS